VTPEQFDKGYVKLRQRHPSHPLMGVIARGYGPLACEYLEIALKQAETPVEVRADSLFSKKQHLYSQRAVLSNKFHIATSDRERADISMQIGSIQEEIKEVIQAIDHYKTTGRLPKTTIRDKYLPVDGRAREKKLKSVRSQISRYRRLVRTTTDDAKIKEYEKRIQSYRDLARELAA